MSQAHWAESQYNTCDRCGNDNGEIFDEDEMLCNACYDYKWGKEE